MPDLHDNLQRVRERVARAAERSGRDAAQVRLVAVTKGCGPATVRGLWQLGLREFGENRVQEAVTKMALDLPGVRWHLIGHLQANKINKILPHVGMVQSLDSWRLATALDDRARRLGRRVPVLLEVKTSSEDTKHGVEPEAVPEIYGRVAELPGLELEGLMTIGPLDDTGGARRRSFRQCREIFERLRVSGTPPRILSMGMSEDLEAAIEEGANMIRVGRALCA